MCKHDSSVFIEGLKVCTSCGLFLDERQYVTGFNSSYTPLYIYSRSIRFRNCIARYSILNSKTEEMVEIFKNIETVWNENKTNWKRRYFLNLKFVAYEIAGLKGIHLNVIYGECMKDISRILDQRVMFKFLISNIKTCSSRDRSSQKPLGLNLAVNLPSHFLN